MAGKEDSPDKGLTVEDIEHLGFRGFAASDLGRFRNRKKIKTSAWRMNCTPRVDLSPLLPGFRV